MLEDNPQLNSTEQGVTNSYLRWLPLSLFHSKINIFVFGNSFPESWIPF